MPITTISRRHGIEENKRQVVFERLGIALSCAWLATSAHLNLLSHFIDGKCSKHIPPILLCFADWHRCNHSRAGRIQTSLLHALFLTLTRQLSGFVGEAHLWLCYEDGS